MKYFFNAVCLSRWRGGHEDGKMEAIVTNNKDSLAKGHLKDPSLLHK
jgi:hypothetical protein